MHPDAVDRQAPRHGEDDDIFTLYDLCRYEPHSERLGGTPHYRFGECLRKTSYKHGLAQTLDCAVPSGGRLSRRMEPRRVSQSAGEDRFHQMHRQCRVARNSWCGSRANSVPPTHVVPPGAGNDSRLRSLDLWSGLSSFWKGCQRLRAVWVEMGIESQHS